MTTQTQLTCAERIGAEYQERIADLRALVEAYLNGEDYVDDLGSLWEYGICFDYIPPGTFNDQEEPYFRYQLSWGGPSDEFRFFAGPDKRPYRVEYWFLDWFDGARLPIYGEDLSLLMQIWELFDEMGAVDKALEDAEAW